MSENLSLNSERKLSSCLFFFTYLDAEESPRKRKKRKKRKVHRMTEGTLIKFRFIQFLTIYKRKTLKHRSLRLSRVICVHVVSVYQIIKIVLPLETDEYKIKSCVFLITRR